jgi:hypothetical protein
MKLQARGRKLPVACTESGDKSRSPERYVEGKSAAQRLFRFFALHLGAQKSLLLRVGLRRRLLPDLVPKSVPKVRWHKNYYSCR